MRLSLIEDLAVYVFSEGQRELADMMRYLNISLKSTSMPPEVPLAESGGMKVQMPANLRLKLYDTTTGELHRAQIDLPVTLPKVVRSKLANVRSVCNSSDCADSPGNPRATALQPFFGFWPNLYRQVVS